MIPVPNGPRVELRAINNPQFEKDGKTYEITRIRRRIGGEGADWEDLDLSKLSADEINQFMQSAQKASKFINKIGGMPAAFKTAHSFTLHFKENEQKNEPFLLDKVTYIQTKGGNEQAHTIEQDRFSKETRLKMSKKFHSLNITIKTVFHRTMEKKPPLDIEEKQPSSQQPPVDPTKNPNYKPKIEEID